MNADQYPDPFDRLRQILRQGDPAAQEPGLTQDEVHAMRRAVLTATPEPRRRVVWFPLLAAGTAALLVLALVIALDHRHPASSTPPAAPRVAAPPSPAPPLPEAQPPEPMKSSRPPRRRPVRAPKVLPIRQDAPMLASLPVREIQFSTPGGTRVIWELSTEAGR
jgi:hypothetical protein